MSVTRMPMYIWSDDASIHLWIRKRPEGETVDHTKPYMDPEDPEDYGMEGGIAIPLPLWEEIVAVEWAGMVQDGLAENAIARCLRPGSATYGNAAGMDLREMFGEDPLGEMQARADKGKCQFIEGLYAFWMNAPFELVYKEVSV